MNVLATNFLITFWEVGGLSVITFAVVWASRRKGRELTFLRGAAVFMIGWGMGSVLVLIVHLLLSIVGGIEIRDGPLEGSISMLVGILVMYAVYGWLSKKRA